MPKTWIHDQKDLTPYDDPNELATANAAIDCVGWWKAGDWTLTQATGRGDGLWHLQQWTDSSHINLNLNNNHLTGGNTGALPFGTGTNAHGDSTDQLNGYDVADFTNDTSEDGSGAGEYYLRVNPATDDHFCMGGGGNNAAANFLNIIVVAKHHIGASASGWGTGDWQIIAAADRHADNASSGDDEWAFGLNTQTTLGTVSFAQQLSYKDDDDFCPASTNSDSVTPGTWYVLGCFGTEEQTSPQQTSFEKQALLDVDGAGGVHSECASFMDTKVGLVGSNGNMYIGRTLSGFGQDPYTFHGRIAEMAIWKSTNPFTAAERLEALNYMKHKFGL